MRPLAFNNLIYMKSWSPNLDAAEWYELANSSSLLFFRARVGSIIHIWWSVHDVSSLKFTSGVTPADDLLMVGFRTRVGSIIHIWWSVHDASSLSISSEVGCWIRPRDHLHSSQMHYLLGHVGPTLNEPAMINVRNNKCLWEFFHITQSWQCCQLCIAS